MAVYRMSASNVLMGEVRVNQTLLFNSYSYFFEFLKKLFFMSCCASGGYLKLPINKKFFIPELILIFVPLQKFRPSKIP